MTTHAPLPTPQEMIAHLDRFVRGQARAKQDISVAVYNHYISQAWRDRHGHDLGRYHILMIGPTGVGKTLLVKTLAELLGVPVGFASATGLVEVGYKGNSVETIVRTLLDRCGGDARRAERGIVFIDEIDKIRRRAGSERDVSGEGVQNALLTLLDGRISEGTEGYGHAQVDTGRILFVCTGAFVGLSDIVGSRLGARSSTFGFRPRASERGRPIPDMPIYESLCQAETRDLVEFGMIPEFIGRFATVAVLHELSRRELRDIVMEGTENSALARAMTLARVHGIELRVEDDALDAIVDEAIALGTGARGIHRLIGRAVDAVDHRWAELAKQGVTEVLIDRAAAMNIGEPTLIKGVLSCEPLDQQLRVEALAPTRPQGRDGARSSAESSSQREGVGAKGLTDTTGWDEAHFDAAIDQVKRLHLGWEECDGYARAVWEKFERECRSIKPKVFRLLEELRNRRTTIREFLSALEQSGTDDIAANLLYIDFVQARSDAERRQRPPA
jgi:ATP-dependent Clp protease ATP-binding subunit ClpX